MVVGRSSDANPKYTPDSTFWQPPTESPEIGMFAVGIWSSFEPRPKPLMTGPERRSGNGGSGPFSGPTMRDRSVAGARMVEV